MVFGGEIPERMEKGQQKYRISKGEQTDIKRIADGLQKNSKGWFMMIYPFDIL